MNGYWFNFNRGFIQPMNTFKLNKRYVGIPVIPKHEYINYVLAKVGLFNKAPHISYVFNSGYTPFYKASKSPYRFSGTEFTLFTKENKIKYNFANNYTCDWRGDNG